MKKGIIKSVAIMLVVTFLASVGAVIPAQAKEKFMYIVAEEYKKGLWYPQNEYDLEDRTARTSFYMCRSSFGMKESTLHLKVKNAGGKKVIWKSEKPKVASVSKKGVVTAHKLGRARITAKIGKKTRDCFVEIGKHTFAISDIPEDVWYENFDFYEHVKQYDDGEHCLYCGAKASNDARTPKVEGEALNQFVKDITTPEMSEEDMYLAFEAWDTLAHGFCVPTPPWIVPDFRVFRPFQDLGENVPIYAGGFDTNEAYEQVKDRLTPGAYKYIPDWFENEKAQKALCAEVDSAQTESEKYGDLYCLITDKYCYESYVKYGDNRDPEEKKRILEGFWEGYEERKKEYVDKYGSLREYEDILEHGSLEELDELQKILEAKREQESPKCSELVDRWEKASEEMVRNNWDIYEEWVKPKYDKYHQIVPHVTNACDSFASGKGWDLDGMAERSFLAFHAMGIDTILINGDFYGDGDDVNICLFKLSDGWHSYTMVTQSYYPENRVSVDDFKKGGALDGFTRSPKKEAELLRKINAAEVHGKLYDEYMKKNKKLPKELRP